MFKGHYWRVRTWEKHPVWLWECFKILFLRLVLYRDITLFQCNSCFDARPTRPTFSLSKEAALCKNLCYIFIFIVVAPICSSFVLWWCALNYYTTTVCSASVSLTWPLPPPLRGMRRKMAHVPVYIVLSHLCKEKAIHLTANINTTIVIGVYVM